MYFIILFIRILGKTFQKKFFKIKKNVYIFKRLYFFLQLKVFMWHMWYFIAKVSATIKIKIFLINQLTIRLYLHCTSTIVVNISCRYLWLLLLTCTFERLTVPFLRITLFLRLVTALVSLTIVEPVPPSVPLLFKEYRLDVLLERYRPLKEQ